MIVFSDSRDPIFNSRIGSQKHFKIPGYYFPTVQTVIICSFLPCTDDVSEEELLAVRREAANNMKMTGSMCPVISEERNDLIKRSLQFKADDMQESKAQSPR